MVPQILLMVLFSAALFGLDIDDWDEALTLLLLYAVTLVMVVRLGRDS